MQMLFFLTVFLLLCVHVTHQEVAEMKQVPPRSFPYVADIESHEWCHGVLITENYIVTNARCVIGTDNIQIYLGWYSYPEDKKPVNESDIQIYSSGAIIVHPEYKVIKKWWSYVNDIALVKLAQAVSITSGVKPAVLANPKIFGNKSLAGQYGNVFGWWPAHYLSTATVQIKTHEDCRDIFGRNYEKDRHLCVKWPLGDRLCSHHSLPLEINKSLIGIMVDDPQNDIACDQFEYKFLNILFYYDWIIKNSDLGEYLANNKDIGNSFNHGYQDRHVVQSEKSQSTVEKDISFMTSLDDGRITPSEGPKEIPASNNNFVLTSKKRCKIDIDVVCPNNKDS